MVTDIGAVTLDDSEEERQHAWATGLAEGNAAGREGAPKTANPYKMGTPAGASWYIGWCQFVEFGPEQLWLF